ncbi:MAG: ABC transporter substrate-binding protein [Pseudomonadota bacterium]
MGPDSALEQPRAAGVTIAIAPEGRGADAVPEKIDFIAGLLERESEADALIAAYWAEMEAVAETIAAVEAPPTVLFVLSVWNAAPIVGGVETPAHDIITLAGDENVAAGVEGWKTFNQEAILSAAPDAILVMGSQLEGMGGVETLLGRPDIALTPAGRAERILTVDGALILQFGPRTHESVRTLAAPLHPELDLGQ